jgi:hypothetical protein
MTELLSELLKGDSVLIETEKLTEFWQFCDTQDNLYAFFYEYSETLVKISIDKKETFLRTKMKNNENNCRI